MIKKWIEFIKESKDNSPIWRPSEEDIKLYLVDMLDIRWDNTTKKVVLKKMVNSQDILDGSY
jgi:hypothetical protein